MVDFVDNDDDDNVDDDDDVIDDDYDFLIKDKGMKNESFFKELNEIEKIIRKRKIFDY